MHGGLDFPVARSLREFFVGLLEGGVPAWVKRGGGVFYWKGEV